VRHITPPPRPPALLRRLVLPPPCTGGRDPQLCALLPHLSHAVRSRARILMVRGVGIACKRLGWLTSPAGPGEASPPQPNAGWEPTGAIRSTAQTCSAAPPRRVS